eukprot:10892287-Ditylum_brightwellii.AAC.1
MEFSSRVESGGVSFSELTDEATMIDAMIASDALVMSVRLLVFTFGDNGGEEEGEIGGFPFSNRSAGVR